MNWPVYADYKESGVAWLGEVPAHWSLRRLGSQFAERKTTVSDQDYEPLSVTMSGIVAQLDTAAKTDNGENRKLVRAGDFVINSRSDRKGSAGLAVRDGSVSVISTVLKPRAISGRFAHHLLRSAAFQEEYYRFGSGIVADLWSTRYSAMKMIRLAIPTAAEQENIADFLDRETAKIDALIDKQNQLITTLREDRTATITHAVTKGLNSEVETIGSGAAWLGSIPAHWTAPQLGMHAAVGNGATPSRERVDFWTSGTVPWLNSSHVNRDEITDADQFVTAKARTECHLPLVSADSVLVGLTGQGKTRGMASILRTPATINQHLAYLTPTGSSLDSEYLHNVLVSAYRVLRDVSEENGSTKGGLTCAALRKLRIPVPPVDEQRRIVAYLCAATARIDLLTRKSAEVVSTLREYRSALITAAVTGKIDVREAA